MPYKDPQRQKDAERRWRERNKGRIRKLWRRNNNKRKGRVGCELTLKAFDAWPYCMFRMFTKDPCFKKPTHHYGAGRVCSDHVSFGYKPIEGAPTKEPDAPATE